MFLYLKKTIEKLTSRQQNFPLPPKRSSQRMDSTETRLPETLILFTDPYLFAHSHRLAADPGEDPRLFLDQTEAQRAENVFSGDLAPLISRSGSGTAVIQAALN